MASWISHDWQRMYVHPIYFLETIVDPERFHGTCYCAANLDCTGFLSLIYAHLPKTHSTSIIRHRLIRV